MRVAKVLRLGRTRTDVGIDVYNLLNANYATAYNTIYVYNTDNAPRARVGRCRRASSSRGSCVST